MPRPGSFTGSPASLAAAFGLLVASLALAACGGSGPSAGAVRTTAPSRAPASELAGLRAASCPAPNLVVHAKRYSRAQIRQALAGRFKIHGHPRRLVAPVDWAQDPYRSRAYRSILASLKWMDVLLVAYQQGNTRALAEARNLAVDWIRHNPRGNPPSDKSWFNKVIGDRAPFLGYIAGAAQCEGMLSPKQARTFVASLEEHGRVLASRRVYVPTNHGLFMDYGLVAMSKEAPYLHDAARWRTLAPTRFQRTLLGRVYPTEGFWLENSSSYHLAARVITHRFVALAGADAPKSLARLAGRMDQVAGWLVEPDGNRVLLGDSNLKATPPSILARAQRDNGLLWLPKSGIAVVKRPAPNPSYLLFGATFHNGSHNQADALSFDLYANGERITSDSGLYDKDPDPYQRFSRSSFSHSVMTIDGKGFPLGAGRAYGSGLRAVGQGGGWYALEGVNPLATLQGVTHYRLLLYRPGVALVVVDLATAKDRHAYTRLFQLASGLDVHRRGDALALSRRDGRFAARLTTSGSTASSLRLVKGRRHPLGGFIFPHYRQAVSRTTAELTAKGADVNQVATFALDPSHLVTAKLVGPASPAAAAVAIQTPGWRQTVVQVVRSGGRLAVHVAR